MRVGLVNIHVPHKIDEIIEFGLFGQMEIYTTGLMNKHSWGFTSTMHTVSYSVWGNLKAKGINSNENAR